MNEGNKRPPPFQSRLNPYKDEILEAWYDRKTLREICELLRQKEVNISIPGLSKFIRSRRLHGDPHGRLAPALKTVDPPREEESLEARSARMGEILRREMAKDPRQIEWEHFVETNQTGKSHGR